MLHPKTRLVWISDDMGYGVVATEPIPRGSVLWVLDPLDRRLGPSEVGRLGPDLMPDIEKYTYFNRRGERVLCWDFGRFMNHNCDPVSLSPGTDFELAVRDLEPGDEITCDYTSLNLEQEFRCLCGSPRCRGTIRAEDFDALAPEWDRKLRDAVRSVMDVEQPLWPWVKHLEDDLKLWSRHPHMLPSSGDHRLRVIEAAEASAE